MVNSPGQTAFPLTKHLWCTSASQTLTINNVAYSCGTYVTQDTSVSNAPYRLTIIITWTGGARGPNKIVRLQSLFTSPPGCTSSISHPFPGPCQGFFSLQANVASADITIARTSSALAPAGLSFTTGDLLAPGVSVTEQTEQSSSISSTLRTAGGTMAGASTSSAGNLTVNAAADDNPDTSITTDSGRRRCGTEVTCTVATSPSITSGSNGISMSIPTTTGESDGTTTAGAAGHHRRLPDRHRRHRQPPLRGGHGIGRRPESQHGPARDEPPVHVIAPARQDRELQHRHGLRQPTVQHRIRLHLAERLDRVRRGQYEPLAGSDHDRRPAGVGRMAQPAGHMGGFLTLTGYQDTSAAAVGSGAAIAVPTIAGTMKCWNGRTAGRTYHSPT